MKLEVTATVGAEFATVHVVDRTGGTTQGVMHGSMYLDRAIELLAWFQSAGMKVTTRQLPVGWEADSHDVNSTAKPEGLMLSPHREIPEMQALFEFDKKADVPTPFEQVPETPSNALHDVAVGEELK